MSYMNSGFLDELVKLAQTPRQLTPRQQRIMASGGTQRQKSIRAARRAPAGGAQGSPQEVTYNYPKPGQKMKPSAEVTYNFAPDDLSDTRKGPVGAAKGLIAKAKGKLERGAPKAVAAARRVGTQKPHQEVTYNYPKPGQKMKPSSEVTYNFAPDNLNDVRKGRRGPVGKIRGAIATAQSAVKQKAPGAIAKFNRMSAPKSRGVATIPGFGPRSNAIPKVKFPSATQPKAPSIARSGAPKPPGMSS